MILSLFDKSDFSVKYHKVCTFKWALSKIAFSDLYLIFSRTVTYTARAILSLKVFPPNWVCLFCCCCCCCCFFVCLFFGGSSLVLHHFQTKQTPCLWRGAADAEIKTLLMRFESYHRFLSLRQE